jgi:lysophospholipase L1-like esterase
MTIGVWTASLKTIAIGMGLTMSIWSISTASAQVPADKPLQRTDANSVKAHEQLVAKTKAGQIDVYFEGDSITRRWGATDYPAFLKNFQSNFFGWNAANFGWGGDSTQNILWRIQNGELDGVAPKVVVLLAGTNNINGRAPADKQIDDISAGIAAIVQVFRDKTPEATIIVMGILPRNDNPAANGIIKGINEKIAGMADGKTIRYLNINDKLADADGKLLSGMSKDRLHLELPAYQIWADALKPILTELLGPPATEDLAPPPTGDPSAKR